MKRKQGNYLQLSRKLFNDPAWQKLSYHAKWLYVVLNELEHRFTSGGKKKKTDFFFRSNKQLCEDTGLKMTTLKAAKKELKPFVQMWNMHWVDENGKKSEQHVTAFRILE